MGKKLSLLILIVAVAACVAMITYRRSHSPAAVIQNRLFYLHLSGIIPTNEPVVDVGEILSGPPFVGVVTNCIVTRAPGSRSGDPTDVVVINIQRDDGVAFVVVAGPASKAELDAAKRLMPGHTYQFPEALELSPND